MENNNKDIDKYLCKNCGEKQKNYYFFTKHKKNCLVKNIILKKINNVDINMNNKNIRQDDSSTFQQNEYIDIKSESYNFCLQKLKNENIKNYGIFSFDIDLLEDISLKEIDAKNKFEIENGKYDNNKNEDFGDKEINQKLKIFLNKKKEKYLNEQLIYLIREKNIFKNLLDSIGINKIKDIENKKIDLTIGNINFFSYYDKDFVEFICDYSVFICCMYLFDREFYKYEPNENVKKIFDSIILLKMKKYILDLDNENYNKNDEKYEHPCEGFIYINFIDHLKKHIKEYF